MSSSSSSTSSISNIAITAQRSHHNDNEKIVSTKLPLTTRDIGGISISNDNMNKNNKNDDIPTVGPMDILSGRGRQAWNNTGNQLFRKVVHQNIQRYMDAETNRDKTEVIASVLKYLTCEVGARFVKVQKSKGASSSSTIKVLGKREAHEKIGHAMRDIAKQRRDAMKEQQDQQQRVPSAATANITTVAFPKPMPFGTTNELSSSTHSVGSTTSSSSGSSYASSCYSSSSSEEDNCNDNNAPGSGFDYFEPSRKFANDVMKSTFSSSTSSSCATTTLQRSLLRRDSSMPLDAKLIFNGLFNYNNNNCNNKCSIMNGNNNIGNIDDIINTVLNSNKVNDMNNSNYTFIDSTSCHNTMGPTHVQRLQDDLMLNNNSIENDTNNNDLFEPIPVENITW